MSRALRIALLAAAAVALHFGCAEAIEACDLGARLVSEAPLVLAAAAAVYVLAMALPFVPGIEIGLALMLLLGEPGIALVYLCTQLALALGYAAGRFLPRPALPGAWAERLRRRPALALAALINLPGNAAIGGAGGIAVLAGAARLLPFWRYVLVMAVATTPLPLALLVL
jgi:hypothetical protein